MPRNSASTKGANVTVQPTIDEHQARQLLGSIKAPCLSPESVAAHVSTHFGLTGSYDRLRGEREQNFRLTTDSGKVFVVKLASPQEDRDTLLLQAEALEHLRRIDPELIVPWVRKTLAGELLSILTDAQGLHHPVRVLSFVEGATVSDMLRGGHTTLTLGALRNLGEAQGRLARALQGFNHHAALRPMPWHLANGLVLGEWLRAHIPPEIADDVEAALRVFRTHTLDALPRLRSQVIYNDFHDSNVLVRLDPELQVIGVIDFGDMVYGTIAQDLAVSIASFIHWSADPSLAAAAIVQGYQRHMPLEAADIAVLKDLVLARLVLHVALVSYQSSANGRRDANLDALQSLYVTAISRLVRIGDGDFIASMIPAVVPGPAQIAASEVTGHLDLMARREAVLGKTYTFYDQPLQLVRGRGTKLFDVAGREYLDCYNNVPNVGHSHPHVVAALAHQAATLNTNSRYLHPEIVRLGERLSATLPEGLDTWIFVCTGSEANDLAVRIARSVTGSNGVVITEKAYHGNTSVVAPLSPLEYDIRNKPDWVEAVPPPNLYRGPYREGVNDAGARYAGHVADAAAALGARGHGVAALLMDSIFDANGALVPPPDYLQRAFQATRNAGGLCIADEVQIGFGRSGTHMWGFQAFGVQPDIVTMGKPMGNGHPIAALVTRREIALEFQKRSGYFNTFGGNTVSAAVANATLDVLQGDGLQANAHHVGAYLAEGLSGLMQRHALVGHVHGRGLFRGVDLVADRDSRDPAKLAARWVRERMKTLGVLVSSSGPLGNIMKIRPPLAFSIADADRCIWALDTALGEVPSELRVSTAAV